MINDLHKATLSAADHDVEDKISIMFLTFSPVFCSHGLCVWRWLTPTQAAGTALDT